MKVFPVYQPYHKRCRMVFVDIGEDRWDMMTVNERLEFIFREGQNEFNPVPGVCSVSVGDVVFLEGCIHICKPVAWRELTATELHQYCMMNEDQQWEYARDFNRSEQDAK